jgi:chromate transporter
VSESQPHIEQNDIVPFHEALRTWARVAALSFGGPYVEALIGNERLKAALSAVTAAVVGVILNLAIWFALHVLFADVMQTRWGLLSLPVPALHSIQGPALVIATAAMIATFGFKTRMIPLLAACCAAGVAWHLVSGVM